MKRKSVIKIIIFCLIIISIPSFIYLDKKYRPISRDSGACGGGYNSSVFQSYENTINDLIIKNSKLKKLNSSSDLKYDMEDVTIDTKDRTMTATIVFKHLDKNFKVILTGEKYWPDKFNWSFRSIKQI